MPTAAAATATPAASCTTSHQNVEGTDTTGPHYGNFSDIYVNTSATLSTLHADIAHSNFVVSQNGDDVEVGWEDHNGNYYVPTTYAEWINNGVDSGPQAFTSADLGYNTSYVFAVLNVGHQYIFRFYVGSLSSAFNYSPTMNFGSGTMLTNSERYNTCDTMYDDHSDIQYYSISGNFEPYGNLAEAACSATGGWGFQVLSSTEDVTNQAAQNVCS